MSENSSTSYSVPGFATFLTLLFVGLKLTGHIDWSWWWVLSPIWGPLAVLVGIPLVILLFSASALAIISLIERCSK